MASAWIGRRPSSMLRFSEPVAPVAVRLLDGRGTEVPGVTVEPHGEALIVRPSVTLPEGAYLLSYRVTSVDSHPVGATLRFGIGVEPIPAQSEAAVEQAARWTGFLARWLVYVTALGAAGLALFVEVVQPPEPVASRTRKLLDWTAAAGIAAVLLRLSTAGLELVGLSPVALLSGAPWAAVASTTLAWATAVAVLGLALLLLSGRLGSSWMRVLGAVVVAGSFALTGHAASAEPRWLAEPALAVHTLCGAFWLASFLPLLWCLRLAPGKAYLALRRFSAAATGAVVALVVAGACLAWLQLGGALEPLWTSAYGLRIKGDVVDVEIARGARDLGHVEPIVALVRLTWIERVVEPPELKERRQEQRLRARPEAHGAVEAALEDRQPAVRLQPDQEQLAALVGRERKGEVLLGEPARELARRQSRPGNRCIRRRLVHSPPRRASLGVTPLRSRWCRPRSGPGAAPGRP